MIVLGVILLIIGFIAKVAILWTIGIILLVIGLVLALLGMAGHAVGGRRHWNVSDLELSPCRVVQRLHFQDLPLRFAVKLDKYSRPSA